MSKRSCIPGTSKYIIPGKAYYVEDRIVLRRFSQSPVTHANHEDTLTNVRSLRSAINDGPSWIVDVQEYNPKSPESRKGSSTRTTHTHSHFTLTFHIEISLRDMRESVFVEETYCHHKKKEICTSRPRPNPSETNTRPTSSEKTTSIILYNKEKRTPKQVGCRYNELSQTIYIRDKKI